MLVELLPWIGFIALVVGLLALDLGVFHRGAHVMQRREALGWSGVWIGLALLFNLGVFVLMGRQAGIEWFTGYVVEKSLAVDNIFVILLIFTSLAVPAHHASPLPPLPFSAASSQTASASSSHNPAAASRWPAPVMIAVLATSGRR